MHCKTHRKADGKGTTGANYDMAVVGSYPRDIAFNSKNLAAFVENIFRIADEFLIIPAYVMNGWKDRFQAVMHLLQTVRKLF